MTAGRISWLVCAACLAAALYVGYTRLLQADRTEAVPFDPFAPTPLQAVMREMDGVERGLQDDLRLLKPDDGELVAYKALAVASLAKDLQDDVPPDLSRSSRADWDRMLTALIESSRSLAVLAENEQSDGHQVWQAHESMKQTCVQCHLAFGVK